MNNNYSSLLEWMIGFIWMVSHLLMFQFSCLWVGMKKQLVNHLGCDVQGLLHALNPMHISWHSYGPPPSNNCTSLKIFCVHQFIAADGTTLRTNLVHQLEQERRKAKEKWRT